MHLRSRPSSQAALLAAVLGLAVAGSCALPAGHATDEVSAQSARGPHSADPPGSTASATPVTPVTAATDTWQRAWHAEDVFPDPTPSTTTCRFSARLTAGGSALRATFASAGPGPGYRILAASVARPVAPHSLDVRPDTSVPLHFDGFPAVPVTNRSEVVTDPVPLAVSAGSDVLVTVTASAGDGYRKGGFVEPGACTATDLTGAATAPAQAFPTPGHVRWLRSLLVDGPPVRNVVAFGDSLTEGPESSAFTYERWSDQLVSSGVAVANAGVGGGALSRMGMFGTVPGTERAQRLLQDPQVPGARSTSGTAEPHVDDLVVMLGTNDLGYGQTTEQIIAALNTIVSDATKSGTQLWICTLLPRGAPLGSAVEQRRLVANLALLSGRFSPFGVKVIDTSAVVTDPGATNRLAPAYDAGDHLHIDVDGARRIGVAVRAALNAPKPPALVPASVS